MDYWTPEEIKSFGRIAVDIRDMAADENYDCFYAGRRFAIDKVALVNRELAHKLLDDIDACENVYDPNYKGFINIFEQDVGRMFKIMIESFQARNKK